MERKTRSLAFLAVVISLLVPTCLGQDTADQVLKQQAPYTLSLELEFTRKNQNPLQRAISFLDWGTNGYATGFVVGDGLAMTAYHVVSGELSDSKKAALGFSHKDKLDVKVFVNGCQATVIRVDKQADLALLGICRSQKIKTPAFQTLPDKDEKLLLIARPHGDKMVSRGTFYGTYYFGGQQYWSAIIEARDGYSGSPVYNHKAEVVGVFSGYDWSKKLALISPAARAQKLLEDYVSKPNP
jgi:Trypsin-like peptidase domain